MVAIALFYTVLSFSYSFVGFLHYQPGSHFHEYAFAKLAIEIGGHFIFGFAAAIPLLDFGVAILAGSLAVLLDSDHILSALNFPVSGRPDHSLLFMLVSTLLILYLGSRMRLSRNLILKLVFVGPVTLLAHISYDVFAASGSTFQLLIPFDFAQIYLPYYAWAVFEAAALLLSFLGLYLSRLSTSQTKTVRNVMC